MKILSVTLKHYNKFHYSGIRELKLTASSAMQLILGTNGSGKSSLLQALNPLPLPPSDFQEDGLRILELEHNLDHYRLVSSYSRKGGHHRFEVNGEQHNLNGGGTAKIQKELVEKEFGLTPKLQDLFRGKILFTRMSTTERREWITSLSDLDLTFVNALYQQVKTRARDCQGALKHYETRLAQESEHLLKPKEIATMKKKRKVLEARMTFWLEKSNNDLQPFTELKKDYDQKVDRLTALSKEIHALPLHFPQYGAYRSQQAIAEQEQQLRIEESALSARLSELEESSIETQKVIGQLQNEQAIDLQGLENKLTVLYEQQAKLSTVSEDYTVMGDIGKTLEETRALKFTIMEVSSQLTGDRLTVPERSQWQATQEQYQALLHKERAATNRLSNLELRQAEIEKARENQCPKCHYQWRDGVSEKELAELTDAIARQQPVVTQLSNQCQQLGDTVQAMETRQQELNQFKALSRSYPRLSSFWHFMADQKMIERCPERIYSVFCEWEEALCNALSRESLAQEISKVEETIALLQAEGQLANLDYLTRREEEQLKKIKKTQKDLIAQREQLASFVDYRKIFTRAYQKGQAMLAEITTLDAAIDELMKSYFQEYVQEQYSKDQSELAIVGHKLTRADAVTEVLADLKSQIKTLTEQKEIYQTMELALSPTEGLTADTMKGFVSLFVEQVNSLIARIWEYDLRLEALDGEGELSYRFPLSIDQKPLTVADISKCSAGQEEVINLAFMLTVMHLMELSDYPLLLDEPATAFDETHRRNLALLNKELLESGQCSQIWMVSHFMPEIGGIIDTETCVLDKSNIAVPSHYNAHVQLSF